MIDKPFVTPSQGPSTSHSGRRSVAGGKRGKSVFGSKRDRGLNGEARIGFTPHAAGCTLFRTTDRDKQPASQVMTGLLLGDPEVPDRYLSNAEPPEEHYRTQRLAARRYQPKDA